MNSANRLEQLKQQYAELSKKFVTALHDNLSFDELELLRKKIREINAEISAIEKDKPDQT